MSYLDLAGGILNDAFNDMHLELSTLQRARERNRARAFIKNCWLQKYLAISAEDLYVRWEKHHNLKHQPLDYEDAWCINNVEFPDKESAYKFWTRNPDTTLSHKGVVVRKAIACPLVILDKKGVYWLRHKNKATYKSKAGISSVFDIEKAKGITRLEQIADEVEIVKDKRGHIINAIVNGVEVF